MSLPPLPPWAEWRHTDGSFWLYCLQCQKFASSSHQTSEKHRYWTGQTTLLPDYVHEVVISTFNLPQQSTQPPPPPTTPPTGPTIGPPPPPNAKHTATPPATSTYDPRAGLTMLHLLDVKRPTGCESGNSSDVSSTNETNPWADFSSTPPPKLPTAKPTPPPLKSPPTPAPKMT